MKENKKTLGFALFAIVLFLCASLMHAQSAVDLPDSLPTLSSVDKLLDHALEQVEHGGTAEIHVYSADIDWRRDIKQSATIQVVGRDIRDVLAEMRSVKFRVPIIDPTKARIQVHGVIYGPKKENDSRDILFEGSRSYKLQNVGGKWVVPQDAQKVELYLVWQTPIVLPVVVTSAEVLTRDTDGDARWNSIPTENGVLRLQKNLAGANLAMRIYYRRADDTYSNKVYALNTGFAITAQEVEPRHDVSIESFMDFSDANLGVGNGLDMLVTVDYWRSYSPLVRLNLNAGRKVRLMAAAVDINDKDNSVREVPYAVELRRHGAQGTLLIPLDLLPKGKTEYKPHEMELGPGRYSLYFHWRTNFQNRERFVPEPVTPSVGTKG